MFKNVVALTVVMLEKMVVSLVIDKAQDVVCLVAWIPLESSLVQEIRVSGLSGERMKRNLNAIQWFAHGLHAGLSLWL